MKELHVAVRAATARIGSSQRQRLKDERLGPPGAFLLFLFGRI